MAHVLDGAAPLAGLARAVCPGSHVAFEVGEVRRGSVLLERSVWGSGNNVRGTNTSRIVLLRRT